MGDGYLEPYIFIAGKPRTRGQTSGAPVGNHGKDSVALRPVDIDQTLTTMPSSSAEALADQSWLRSLKLSLAIGPDRALAPELCTTLP
jgi:hypothetical protein